MLVTIVFAVLILLVLIIGFFFLSSSDIFLVFSIVAFMVLVVLSVDFVVSRRKRIAKKERKKREREKRERERQEEQRPEQERPELERPEREKREGQEEQKQEEQRSEQERSEEKREREKREREKREREKREREKREEQEGQRLEQENPGRQEEQSIIQITNDSVTITTGEDVIEYQKSILDVDDIFVDKTWEEQMIRSMLYDKIAISFANPKQIKTLFWRPYDFELTISNRMYTIPRANAIYSFVKKAKKLIKNLGIYSRPISSASMYGILKKGSFIADEEDFRKEMNKVTDQEKEEYKQYKRAKKGVDSKDLKDFVVGAEKGYETFLEKNRLIKIFQRMVEVETGISNELYPLTWFYRTPHEKLKTIFLKSSWSKREKYKQAYVVLYFSIARFVNKVIDDNGRKKLKDLEDSELDLIPPLSAIYQDKKQFIGSIREANQRGINQEIGLLTERLEDIQMYYEFYKSLDDDSIKNFPELLRLYTEIAGYVYRNRKKFLFYNIAVRNGPEMDLIYAPLFIYTSFPDLINVTKHATIDNDKSLFLSLDHEDFRKKIGEVQEKITDKVIDYRFTPVIMCCFFFNFTFEEFENFVKALFVILFYISVTSLENFFDVFVLMKSLFYDREFFKNNFISDYRFRGSMVFSLYQSLFSSSQSFKDFLETIRRIGDFRGETIRGLSSEAKKIEKEIKQIPDKTEKEEKLKKLQEKEQEIANNQELLMKEQRSSETLIKRVEMLFPIQTENLQSIEVPDFRRKLKEYKFDFEDIEFILSCYQYILNVLVSNDQYIFDYMPFKEEMQGKYRIGSLNGM